MSSFFARLLAEASVLFFDGFRFDMPAQTALAFLRCAALYAATFIRFD